MAEWQGWQTPAGWAGASAELIASRRTARFTPLRYTTGGRPSFSRFPESVEHEVRR